MLKNPIYSFIEKKNIELLTNKTYQETIGFLALLRIEQGFPFHRKLKSMKGKQAETIWARIGKAERRRREQLGGPGNFENFSALRHNLVHFGCPN